MLLAAAVVAVIVLVVVAMVAVSGPFASQPRAQNVIVLIDDGAGYNHHEAGSLYDTGLRGGEVYNDFPVQFAVTTYSFGDVAVGTCGETPVGYDPAQAWSDFEYVTHDPTDSAAAGTALSTGVKTYDAAIGVDCQGAPEVDIVTVMEQLGKATGVVTSVPFSHATPATFVAHNVDRDDGPAIAREMIFDSSTDVIMGAGHPWFNAAGKVDDEGGFKWIDQSDWQALVAGTAGADADGDGDSDPWVLVEDRAQFQALMDGPTPPRVIGVAQVRRTLQEDRNGEATAAPFAVPMNDSVPTLAEMTVGALNVVDDDPDGFFLMIEGGATDFASHDGLPGRMVEEEVAFDRAVDAVVAWVEAHSSWEETLVIVTSDHETGYLTGPGSGATANGPAWNPLVDHGQGVLPGMQFNLPDADGKYAHTNGLVPVYAKGVAADLLGKTVDGTDPVRGQYVDNTDIHQLLVDAVGAAEN
jgi:alkaline phosphatase